LHAEIAVARCEPAGNRLERTIRSSILMKYTSPESEKLLTGPTVNPALRLTDVSSFRDGTPKARATPLRLLAVSTRRATCSPVASSVRNCVLTLLNHDWCSDGARKPVLAAPRRAKSVVNSKRVATLPVSRLPKSL
jgi:hypothetical protein